MGVNTEVFGCQSKSMSVWDGAGVVALRHSGQVVELLLRDKIRWSWIDSMPVGLSFGLMPAKASKLSVGVARRHPMTMSKASLVESIRRARALRHRTGAQYSAVEWTRARVVTWTC